MTVFWLKVISLSEFLLFLVQNCILRLSLDSKKEIILVFLTTLCFKALSTIIEISIETIVLSFTIPFPHVFHIVYF